MRYRLSTLVLMTAIGPPAIAATWFALPYLPEAVVILVVLVAAILAIGLSLAAAMLPIMALGWLLSLIGKALLYFGRHPDNRM
jgi:hypothetical protein